MYSGRTRLYTPTTASAEEYALGPTIATSGIAENLGELAQVLHCNRERAIDFAAASNARNSLETSTGFGRRAAIGQDPIFNLDAKVECEIACARRYGRFQNR